MSYIAEYANPFYLRELYLDGCDKINDQALANLVMRRQNKDMISIPSVEEMDQYFNPDGSIYIHNFQSIASSTNEELIFTICDMA